MNRLAQVKKVVLENLPKSKYRFIGDIVVIKGRGEKVLRGVAKRVGAFADLFLNDPPYGTTLCPWDSVIPMADYWSAANAACFSKSAQIVFGSQPFTSSVVASNVKNFRHELIWDKQKCGSPGLAKIRPMKVHENILVFSQKSGHYYYPIMEAGEAYARKAPKRNLNNHNYGLKPVDISNKGTRYPKSIRIVPRNFSAQQQVHPTQKPVPLLEWLIEAYCPKNQIIADMTCGSGSSGVAAIQTNRPAVLIEKDPIFFKLTCDWCTAVYKGKDWNPAVYRKHMLAKSD